MPTPKTVLRVTAVACLVAAFVSLVASNGAHGFARDLAGFLLIPFLLFGLFYLEYAIVQAVLHRDLDLRLGYVQALGCLGLTAIAVLMLSFTRLAGAALPSAFVEYTLLLTGAFGETVFVGNVVWTYMRPAQPAPRPPAPPATPPPQTTVAAPPVKAENAKPWGFPQSPGRVFAIAAAFFVVTGMILVHGGLMDARLPFPANGEVVQVPAGYLWIITAAPFALFALVYGAIEYFSDRVFVLSTTRIHFICTLLAVAEGLREYVSWASAWANPHPWNAAPASQGGVSAFGLLVLASFSWNLWTSKREPVRR